MKKKALSYYNVLKMSIGRYIMDNLKALRRALFFVSFPFSFIAFVFPIYAYSMDISIMEVGLLYSVFAMFSIIIRPAVGIFIDKKGRKLGLILGLTFYCLVNLLLILGKSFPYLIVARMFQGIANSFLLVSLDTIASDLSHEKNRAEIFGIIDQSMNKGDLIGVLLGFSIVCYLFQGSFEIAFLLYFVASLLSLYYAFLKLKETNPCHYEEINYNGDFNVFLIIMGLYSFVFSLTGHIYLIYIKENIAEEIYLIGYLFLPGAVLSMFLPKRFGKLSDEHSREKAYLISLLATGILYIFIPKVKRYMFFLIVHTIIYVFSMIEGPAESALVIDVVGENRRGKSYGKYKFAVGMGGIFGPLAGSYIYEKIGSEIVFYFKGILIIMLCLFTAIYFRTMKRKRIKGKINKWNS